MAIAHVLILPSWYPLNNEDVRGNFFRQQALALSEAKYKVGVTAVNFHSLRLGFSSEKKTHISKTSREYDKGVITYRRSVLEALPRVPYGNYYLWRRAARQLLEEYVQAEGWPDLIHAHCTLYAGSVAAEWRRQYSLPVVLTEHSTGFARGIYRAWQLRLANKTAAEVDACVTVSPALREVLEDKLPSSCGRWEWVPNVVAPRFYSASLLKRPTSRPVRFLNLALMTEKKGQKDLLTAFAQAFGSKGDTTELWLGGDGPLRNSLEDRARALGIAARVHFLGRVPPDKVPELFWQIDAMVVASHYETFGVVAAEALMAGVPVVATRCGGPECIVRDGDGILVPPHSVAELANGLREMADNHYAFDHSSIAKRAYNRFSGESVTYQLKRIYDKVLLNRPNSIVSG